MDAPEELLDPDGEGIYILGSAGGGRTGLRHVALRLFGDARRWRDLNVEVVAMRPTEGDEWCRVKWRSWQFSLPRRWRPVAYLYCTPKPNSQ